MNIACHKVLEMRFSTSQWCVKLKLHHLSIPIGFAVGKKLTSLDRNVCCMCVCDCDFLFCLTIKRLRNKIRLNRANNSITIKWIRLLLLWHLLWPFLSWWWWLKENLMRLTILQWRVIPFSLPRISIAYWGIDWKWFNSNETILRTASWFLPSIVCVFVSFCQSSLRCRKSLNMRPNFRWNVNGWLDDRWLDASGPNMCHSPGGLIGNLDRKE